MDKKKLIIIGILLSISILNYTRLEGSENIKNIHFLTIFTIGVLSGLLIYGIVNYFKNKK
jgi:hypothetical protein